MIITEYFSEASGLFFKYDSKTKIPDNAFVRGFAIVRYLEDNVIKENWVDENYNVISPVGFKCCFHIKDSIFSGITFNNQNIYFTPLFLLIKEEMNKTSYIMLDEEAKEILKKCNKKYKLTKIRKFIALEFARSDLVTSN